MYNPNGCSANNKQTPNNSLNPYLYYQNLKRQDINHLSPRTDDLYCLHCVWHCPPAGLPHLPDASELWRHVWYLLCYDCWCSILTGCTEGKKIWLSFKYDHTRSTVIEDQHLFRVVYDCSKTTISLSVTDIVCVLVQLWTQYNGLWLCGCSGCVWHQCFCWLGGGGHQWLY